MRHFWAGFFIGLIFTVIISTVAGLYKEIQDSRKRGSFDVLDLIATVIGGIIGTINPLLAYYIYHRDGELWNAIAWWLGPIIFVSLFWTAFTYGLSWKGYLTTWKKMFGIIR